MNQFDIDYGDVDDIITEEVYDDNISFNDPNHVRVDWFVLKELVFRNGETMATLEENNVVVDNVNEDDSKDVISDKIEQAKDDEDTVRSIHYYDSLGQAHGDALRMTY